MTNIDKPNPDYDPCYRTPETVSGLGAISTREINPAYDPSFNISQDTHAGTSMPVETIASGQTSKDTPVMPGELVDHSSTTEVSHQTSQAGDPGIPA